MNAKELCEKTDRRIIINRIMTQTTMALAFSHISSEEEKKKDIERIYDENYKYLEETFDIIRKKTN